MKTSFIHNPVFRLISPLVAGALAYLLILLFSNSVQDISGEFTSEEFYLCLLLAFIIQETIRFIIKKRTTQGIRDQELLSLFMELVIGIIICILLVCITLYLYFKYILGYYPNANELITFNVIYIFIPILYSLLYGSHKYLYSINKAQLDVEIAKKKIVQADFYQYRKEINPSLLFESFESLIIQNYDNKESADELIDQLAIVYRYILSEKGNELVGINKEIKTSKALVKLLNFSPSRQIEIDHQSINYLNNTTQLDSMLIVPGALLTVIQAISETFISAGRQISIHTNIQNNMFQLNFSGIERIENNLNLEIFKKLQLSFSHFTEEKIKIVKNNSDYEIQLPILELA